MYRVGKKVIIIRKAYEGLIYSEAEAPTPSSMLGVVLIVDMVGRHRLSGRRYRVVNPVGDRWWLPGNLIRPHCMFNNDT